MLLKSVNGLYWPDSIRNVLHPAKQRVVIDPSGDRIFEFLFDDHEPLAIRQEPHEVMHAKLLLAQAEARALH